MTATLSYSDVKRTASTQPIGIGSASHHTDVMIRLAALREYCLTESCWANIWQKP